MDRAPLTVANRTELESGVESVNETNTDNFQRLSGPQIRRSEAAQTIADRRIWGESSVQFSSGVVALLSFWERTGPGCAMFKANVAVMIILYVGNRPSMSIS